MGSQLTGTLHPSTTASPRIYPASPCTRKCRCHEYSPQPPSPRAPRPPSSPTADAAAPHASPSCTHRGRRASTNHREAGRGLRSPSPSQSRAAVGPHRHPCSQTEGIGRVGRLPRPQMLLQLWRTLPQPQKAPRSPCLRLGHHNPSRPHRSSPPLPNQVDPCLQLLRL
jgi:hypothetical protein